jgi:hypothetical protein
MHWRMFSSNIDTSRFAWYGVIFVALAWAMNSSTVGAFLPLLRLTWQSWRMAASRSPADGPGACLVG